MNIDAPLAKGQAAADPVRRDPTGALAIRQLRSRGPGFARAAGHVETDLMLEVTHAMLPDIAPGAMLEMRLTFCVFAFGGRCPCAS